jgi:hypothetical protein
MTLSAYSWTLSRIPRARYDSVRLLLDIVKDTKSQIRQCLPTPGHCQGYQEPGTTLSAYSWTLSRIPRARYYDIVRLLLHFTFSRIPIVRHFIVRLLLDIVKGTKSQVQPVFFGPSGSGSRSFSQVRIRILLSSRYNSKKNLDSYCFVISS